MTELEKLVTEYAKVKKQENEISKMSKELNAKIKKIMQTDDIDEVETASGTARLQERKSEKFDEENLIEFLKASGKARGLVKKKEYLDFDALESAIYREKFDQETLTKLNDFKIVNITYALTVK